MKKANVYIPTHRPGMDIFINYMYEMVDGMLYKEIISMDITLLDCKISATIPAEQMTKKVLDELANIIGDLHFEQNGKEAA